MSSATILRPTRRDPTACHFSQSQTGHQPARSGSERASLGEDHRRPSCSDWRSCTCGNRPSSRCSNIGNPRRGSMPWRIGPWH